MKVILRQDHETLGKLGEVVTVRDGYARNYLLPRKIAYVATPGKLRAIDEEKKQVELRTKKELKIAQQVGQSMQFITLTLTAKSGTEGKLFGSITTMDIASALKAQKFDVDKRSIELEEPIKNLGTYPVTVKLHTDVKVTVNVKVVEEASK